MFVKSMLAATVLAFAAPAFADGNDQFALSIGVEPGVYTTSQLVQLEDAIRSNNQDAVRFIMNQANDVASRSTTDAGENLGAAGNAQYALSLGVAPGEYTLNELVRLDDAIRNNDRETQQFIRSKADRELTARGERSGVSAGKASLAQALGVDANDYTLAQLTQMYHNAIEG